MSSKGATSLKRVLLGSNTVGVINKCSTPVIVVPEHVVISKIHTLVYASDLKNFLPEVQLILPYAKALDASIKIIHVPELNGIEQLQIAPLTNDLMQQTGFRQFNFQIIKGEDIVTTIENYTDKDTGELLVMFTHHVTFLEQLFCKSVARETAWHNKTPMLVINNR
jgi:nucleotide-binding universal stress UspA family protein